MNNLFLAKSNPKETIAEHTGKLLDELERLKNIYPIIPLLDWVSLEMVCKFHDLGKVNTKFQNKLLTNMKVDKLLPDSLTKIKEIPHGYLSCAFFPFRELEKLADKKIIAQAIYFHHNRPASVSEDIKETIQKDLTAYYEELQKHLSFPISEPEFNFLRYASPGKRISKDTDNELLRPFIMVKGLLNKVDHAASAGIPVEIKNPGLVLSLERYFTNKLKSEPNILQNYMRVHKEENNIIIASTGIGKTEGALYWIGDGKGFFTLPLRVSINSIYNRIYNEINFQEVGLLHSETEREYIANDLFSLDYFEQTRQWSMPLTVCTLDQILDFVFKQEGYEKKLATLAYSKLIVDEIQMYSPKMLACLLYALKEITQIGGKFTIMTATFAPFIGDLMEHLKIEINKPEEPFLKIKDRKAVVRHRVLVKDQQLTVTDIKKNKEDGKILVIVNTVNKAQMMYEELKKTRNDVFLFHSRFTKNDRKNKEDAIIRMGDLKTKEKAIWITTQVVEASVDIDFDVLYTELSDLNGLFQRMGRVYRNRFLDHGRINVYVYSGGDGYPTGISSQNSRSIIDKSIFDISKKVLKQFNVPTIFTEEMKMDLIEENYTTKKLKNSLYYRDVQNYLHLLKNIVEYEELDEKLTDLRDIFNETIIPQFVYKENENDINRLISNYKGTFKNKDREEARISRGKLRDELLGYTVDIPKYQVEIAKKLNRHEKVIWLGNSIAIPVVDYSYNDEKGLQYTNEKKLFDSGQFL